MFERLFWNRCPREGVLSRWPDCTSQRRFSRVCFDLSTFMGRRSSPWLNRKLHSGRKSLFRKGISSDDCDACLGHDQVYARGPVGPQHLDPELFFSQSFTSRMQFPVKPGVSAAKKLINDGNDQDLVASELVNHTIRKPMGPATTGVLAQWTPGFR